MEVDDDDDDYGGENGEYGEVVVDDVVHDGCDVVMGDESGDNGLRHSSVVRDRWGKRQVVLLYRNVLVTCYYCCCCCCCYYDCYCCH